MTLDRPSFFRKRDWDETGFDSQPCRDAQALARDLNSGSVSVDDRYSQFIKAVNHVAGCGICGSAEIGGGYTCTNIIVRFSAATIPDSDFGEKV